MRWTHTDSWICLGTVTGISSVLSGLSDVLSVMVLGATLIYTIIRICKEFRS